MSQVYVGYGQFGIEGVDEEFICFIFDVTLGLTTQNNNSEGGVILATDDQMRDMNKRYRGKDVTTNVLSFCNSEIPELSGNEADANYLGDIYISYPVLIAEAKKLGISHKDRFTQLLVHGFLHLLGFDHENNADAKKMEDLEDQITQMVI